MEITVPNSVMIAMGIAMAVSIGLPFGFVIGMRKRMMLLPIVVGIISYCVFSFLLSGAVLSMLFGGMTEATLPAAVLYSLLSSGILLVGHYFMLRYLSDKKAGGGVPMSYGLGYSAVNMVLISGASSFSNLSLVTAINNNGFAKVAETVEDPDSLWELVSTLAETPFQLQLLGSAELVCFFISVLAVSVFVWYAVVIEEKRRQMLLMAVLTELLTTGVLSLYSFGCIGQIAAELIYFAAAIAAAVYAFRVYRAVEGGPKYMADPVRRL